MRNVFKVIICLNIAKLVLSRRRRYYDDNDEDNYDKEQLMREAKYDNEKRLRRIRRWCQTEGRDTKMLHNKAYF